MGQESRQGMGRTVPVCSSMSQTSDGLIWKLELLVIEVLYPYDNTWLGRLKDRLNSGYHKTSTKSLPKCEFALMVISELLDFSHGKFRNAKPSILWGKDGCLMNCSNVALGVALH